MRGITIAAIAGATIAGLLAAVFMLYVPTSRTLADSGGQVQAGNSTQQQSPAPVVDTEENGTGYRTINVIVNGVPLVADVAATGDQRSKGLSVKDHLNENESMLFVFSKANNYQFWMKGMKFPIDIIWLDTNREVIHIEHSLEPCVQEPCPTYGPDGNAQYVLETVAGFAQKYNVTEHTLVEFDPEQLK